MSNLVVNNLKRAYRNPAPKDLPKEMADLLRKLQERESTSEPAE